MDLFFISEFTVARPGIGLLFWTILIFSLFWILVGRFAFRPIKDALLKRENDIQSALDEAKKAKEEIDFYSDQIKNSSESETQFASIDDGSMTSERENMNQIVVRMQKLISHLESALVRIENKSYGICRETGKLIPKERLLVVPHATLSVEGKKMEKK